MPATPAMTMPLIQPANSRMDAITKNAPSRSTVPKIWVRFDACRPGAPKPKAIVEMIIGMRQRRRISHDSSTNSSFQE